MKESSMPLVLETPLVKLEFQLWGFVSETVGGTKSFTTG